MTRRDAAERLLAATVRALPPVRAEWGVAMRAELAGIEASGQRWRFVLGCLHVVAGRRVVWQRFGYPLLTVATLVVTAWWSGRIAYAPMHWSVNGLVGTLVLLLAFGRRRPLGPVGDGRVARGLRAGGYLLLASLTAETVVSLAHKSNHDLTGVLVLTVIFAAYLLGFSAVTAHRSAATARALAVGAGAGGIAVAAWIVAVVLAPPIPANVTSALLLTIAAMGVAAWWAGRRGGMAARVLAGGCAGTVAALVIFSALTLLAAFGPAWLIPNIVPQALTPADQLANSRIELQDPYVLLLLIGAMIAAGLCAMSLASARSAVDESAVTPALAGTTDIE